MKKLLIGLSALLVLLLSGCATPSPRGEIKESNKHISTPNYSITVPSNRGWRHKGADSSDVVYIEKIINKEVYTMRFSTNYAADKKMKSWTAKQVAVDYRSGEFANMMIKGVLGGHYLLKDVKNYEEKVENKKFYVMSYTVTTRRAPKQKQKAYLYLYFPKEKNFGRFFVSNYVEGFPFDKTLSKSFKNEYIKVLNSLEMK